MSLRGKEPININTLKFFAFSFRKISGVTYFIGAFIIISAAFMSQLFSLMRAKVGQAGVNHLIGTVFIVLAIGASFFLIKKRTNLAKLAIAFALLFISLCFIWRMRIPQERIHILEYGILGWFVARDMRQPNNKISSICFACAFGLVIGILDELFQLILPYRVCDTRDIIFNGVGACAGGTLHSLVNK